MKGMQMSELAEKVKVAIKYLRGMEGAAGEDGYYVCYSGGKDSDTIRALCELAGVKYELHHNHTTADAPETVYHVRSIQDVIIHYPKLTMWQLIVLKGFPPTRLTRYCCEYLKEHGGEGRFKVMGVRKAESPKRAERYDLISVIGGKQEAIKVMAEKLDCAYRVTKDGIAMHGDDCATRDLVEACYRKSAAHTSLNPIVDWSDNDVWEFLRYYNVTTNPLYEEGACRVGCIGCPLSGGKQMKREFTRFPKYRQIYVQAFDRMIEISKEKGKFRDDGTWQTGEDVMRWWCGDDPRQITLHDYELIELSAVREEDLE